MLQCFNALSTEGREKEEEEQVSCKRRGEGMVFKEAWTEGHMGEMDTWTDGCRGYETRGKRHSFVTCQPLLVNGIFWRPIGTIL